MTPTESKPASAAGHSPGRLDRNIKPVSKYPIIFAGRNTHVAQVVTGMGMPESVAEANCDRLVACWNACEGISTQDLIAKGRKGAYTDQAHLLIERDALRAEVARLREALQGAYDARPEPVKHTYLRQGDGCTESVLETIEADWVEQARAALGEA